MDIGFETIGNATLIVYDRNPVLVTDPWITGDTYFGSWSMSHEIPEEQQAAIDEASFVWLSHGHPDHLHFESLTSMMNKSVLVPDHLGGRILNFLNSAGFSSHVLPDRSWFQISDRVRVMSIADRNQDAVLLCDINGALVANINDSGIMGSKTYVRKVIRNFPVSFGLFGAPGDVDMINYWDDAGRRILPPPHDKRLSGRMVAERSADLGLRFCIPFSAMHRYQREDSVWAAAYTTDPMEYSAGFDSKSVELLPPFSRVDLSKLVSAENVNPRPKDLVVKLSKDYDDDWSDTLEAADMAAASRYFQSISHISKKYEFINLRVGNEDNVIPLQGSRGCPGPRDTGISFEVPRTSLMKAIQYEVFDDLLIGNFMKTTIHGRRGHPTLYPHFAPYVGKYADNGRAKSQSELRDYFSCYRQRDALGYMREQLTLASAQVVRTYLPQGSLPYRAARNLYRRARRHI